MKHTGEERREHIRIDARISVKFKTDKEFVDCYAQNLSQGGIYLETKTLPDPNATVDLVLDCSKIDSSHLTDELHLIGQVVRLMTEVIDNEPHHRVALQFLDVSPKIKVRLDHLYEVLSKSAPIAVKA